MHQIFSSFFHNLEIFNFTNALKVLKKMYADVGYPWNKLTYSLQNFVTCEATYYKLSYLHSTKVKISETYSQVLVELKALISKSAFEKIGHMPTPGDDTDHSFYYTLIQQVCMLIHIRLEMVKVYFSFVTSLHNEGPLNYDSIVNALNAFLEQTKDKIAHPLLQHMKQNTLYEITVLKLILSVQIALSHMNYKDTIVVLYQVSLDLDAWREVNMKLSMDQKNAQSINSPKHYVNGIHQWLGMFLSALVAKMSLYFYPVLKKTELETCGNCNFMSPKELGSKLDPDYLSVVDNFVQRTTALNFSLVFECKGTTYNRNGYSCNKEDDAPPTGLNSWPAIFSYPKDSPPLQHWPNIISIIMDHYQALDQFREPYLSFFDSKLQHTYFISRVEPQITMVIIYVDKKKHNDVSIWDFVSAMLRALRNRDVFGLLLMKDGRDRL